MIGFIGFIPCRNKCDHAVLDRGVYCLGRVVASVHDPVDRRLAVVVRQDAERAQSKKRSIAASFDRLDAARQRTRTALAHSRSLTGGRLAPAASMPAAGTRGSSSGGGGWDGADSGESQAPRRRGAVGFEG